MRIIIELDDQKLLVRGASSLTDESNQTTGPDAEIDGGRPDTQLFGELGSHPRAISGFGQDAEDTGSPPGWLLEAIQAAELDSPDYFAHDLPSGDVIEIADGGGAPASEDNQ
jgi:hypothetical protein